MVLPQMCSCFVQHRLLYPDSDRCVRVGVHGHERVREPSACEWVFNLG